MKNIEDLYTIWRSSWILLVEQVEALAYSSCVIDTSCVSFPEWGRPFRQLLMLIIGLMSFILHGAAFEDHPEAAAV